MVHGQKRATSDHAWPCGGEQSRALWRAGGERIMLGLGLGDEMGAALTALSGAS